MLEDIIMEYIILQKKSALTAFAAALFAALTKPFAKGDENTYEYRVSQSERVFDKYSNSLLRLAYAYVHNMADAEDILQDTMIRYIKSAPDFENDEHEKAWLITVTSNTAKNKLKYEEIRMADELDENLAEEGRADLSFVWEAVKKLPVKQREVVHLFYEEGYKTAEINLITWTDGKYAYSISITEGTTEENALKLINNK